MTLVRPADCPTSTKCEKGALLLDERADASAGWGKAADAKMGGIDFNSRRRDHLLALPNMDCMDMRLFLLLMDLCFVGAFRADPRRRRTRRESMGL